MKKFYITRPGKETREIEVDRANHDFYGNPRFIIHFLDLGLDKYEATKLTRKAGLSLYRAKWYGGGFVFQSYCVSDSIKFIFKTLHNEDIAIKEGIR